MTKQETINRLEELNFELLCSADLLLAVQTAVEHGATDHTYSDGLFGLYAALDRITKKMSRYIDDLTEHDRQEERTC